MRKAWLLASALIAAGLVSAWAGSASASAAGFVPPATALAQHDGGITKITHRRRYYYTPGYYPNYYYASPYYAYPPAYYPPAIVYAVPPPRYVPGPAYYPYAGYYVRPWRGRYYYGW